MQPRPIVHIEIPASSREATAQFYLQLFGWTFHHTDAPGPYTFFSAGNVNGGFPDMDGVYKPGDLIIYVQSEDLEADLKRIEELGGTTLMHPMAVPGFGAMAMFIDPNGHRLALWKQLEQNRDGQV